MRRRAGKFFLGFIAGMGLFVASAMGADRHSLNGTWKLEPTRSDFAGQPAIQTGTVVINDRQHNIFISRSFSYDGANESLEYSFSTDGRENSNIRQGKTFKSKAKWDGDVLQVRTTDDEGTTVERYTLMPDGSLMLAVERLQHREVRLFFERQ